MQVKKYFEKKVSLLSTSDVRYDGELYTVDPSEQSIALKHVNCMGTEGRRTGDQAIAPSDCTYEFIIFRAVNIRELWLDEGQNRVDLTEEILIPLRQGRQTNNRDMYDEPPKRKVGYQSRSQQQTYDTYYGSGGQRTGPSGGGGGYGGRSGYDYGYGQQAPPPQAPAPPPQPYGYRQPRRDYQRGPPPPATYYDTPQSNNYYNRAPQQPRYQQPRRDYQRGPPPPVQHQQPPQPYGYNQQRRQRPPQYYNQQQQRQPRPPQYYNQGGYNRYPSRPQYGYNNQQRRYDNQQGNRYDNRRYNQQGGRRYDNRQGNRRQGATGKPNENQAGTGAFLDTRRLRGTEIDIKNEQDFDFGAAQHDFKPNESGNPDTPTQQNGVNILDEAPPPNVNNNDDKVDEEPPQPNEDDNVEQEQPQQPINDDEDTKQNEDELHDKKYDKSKSFFDGLQTETKKSKPKQDLQQQKDVDTKTFGSVAATYKSRHMTNRQHRNYNQNRSRNFNQNRYNNYNNQQRPYYQQQQQQQNSRNYNQYNNRQQQYQRQTQNNYTTQKWVRR